MYWTASLMENMQWRKRRKILDWSVTSWCPRWMVWNYVQPSRMKHMLLPYPHYPPDSQGKWRNTNWRAWRRRRLYHQAFNMEVPVAHQQDYRWTSNVRKYSIRTLKWAAVSPSLLGPAAGESHPDCRGQISKGKPSFPSRERAAWIYHAAISTRKWLR